MSQAASTLLETKLFIPAARPGLVARRRLIETLDSALENSLTVLSAPAGFGKTTIVSDWLHSRRPPLRAAWLSLDDSENDPARFWEYFIAALRTVQPGVGEMALRLLRASQPLPVESALTPLLNDLAGAEGDLVLVLDDYHFIQSATVHRGVAFVLGHIPPRMHLIIATRVDPPLSLAGLRGKGALLEIRANQLRFTDGEAADILARHDAPPLSAAEVASINMKTEGWAVGLMMAALSLQGADDPVAFISAFTGTQRYVMDYLIEEVLDTTPGEVRDFLLRTSVLERLNGPLCDAVTGRSGGRETLLALERRNLFLARLDPGGEWHRYHHLFRDLLQNQLESSLGVETKGELHRRASGWYEANGLVEDAIAHALSARDWRKAMALVRHPEVMARRLRTMTLLNWLRRIPGEVLRVNLPVYESYVWALIPAGEYRAVEDCLQYLDSVAENDTLLQGKIAAARAVVAVSAGDPGAAEACARKALALLAPEGGGPGDLPPDRRGTLGTVLVTLATVSLGRGRYTEAEPLLERSLALWRQEGLTGSTIHQLTFLGLIAFMRGELHRAARLLHEALDVEGGDPFIGVTHLCLGNVYYERNDLEKAVRHQERAIEFGPFLRRLPSMSLDQAYFLLARTRAAMGDPGGVAQAMHQADGLLAEDGADRALSQRNAAYHAAIALMEGDREAAAAWARKIEDPAGPGRDQIPVTAMRLAMARWGKEEAERDLNEAYARFAGQGMKNALISVRIVQALESAGPGSPLENIAEALAMARPEGFIRIFVDHGMELAPLLRLAITRGEEPIYASKLLAIIDAEEQRRQIMKARGVPVPESAEFLSLREIEVLRLAAEGSSNQQIAAKLTITLNTAKTHMRNITGKLGARSRTEAVARARALKLI